MLGGLRFNAQFTNSTVYDREWDNNEGLWDTGLMIIECVIKRDEKAIFVLCVCQILII